MVHQYCSNLFWFEKLTQTCVVKILNLLFLEDRQKAHELYSMVFDKVGEGILPMIYYSQQNWERSLNPDRLAKLRGSSSFMIENNYAL